MDISIIIPVLNEQNKITKDIEAANRFIVDQQLQGEIIVSDDGSKDGTSDAAKNVKVSDQVNLQVIESTYHKGKGFAIKNGILRSTGKIVLFIDSGNCIPYHNILRGIEILEKGEIKIVHASRFLQQSKIIHPHRISRQFSSWFFRNVLIFWLNLPFKLTDTQCGLKIYKGDVARDLFSKCITDGFMFDIEMILRAKKEGYYIIEFPVEWTADTDSRLSQLRIPFSMLRELNKIKKALHEEYEN